MKLDSDVAVFVRFLRLSGSPCPVRVQIVSEGYTGMTWTQLGRVGIKWAEQAQQDTGAVCP